MLQTFVNIILDGGFMQERIVLHVDVNNAFLSWTAVDMLNNGSKIDIRNICCVIGGDESQRRGIVLAKSYPAKENGVVTAETLYSARRKCPNLAVYSPDYKLYSKYSNMLYKYLSNYSPLIERYSIDECFLDYTGCEKLFGNPVEVAYKIKEDIKNKFGFTVNVGVGNNKLCAKMASDFSKPDKVHTLFQNEIKDKMWPLNVADLFMIGKKTSLKLHELGINTIYDLAHADYQMLTRHFKSMAKMMIEYANGIDNSKVEGEYDEPKSISASTVFPFDYDNINLIKPIIRNLTIDIGKRLRQHNYYALVIGISIKYSNFYKVSKQRKLNKAISSDIDLYNISLEIFNQLWNGEPIRHVTVFISNFTLHNDIQLSLFENSKTVIYDSKLQKVVDNLRNKFGNDKIIYGDMAKKDKKQ